MICSKCGRECDSGAVICPDCGVILLDVGKTIKMEIPALKESLNKMKKDIEFGKLDITTSRGGKHWRNDPVMCYDISGKFEKKPPILEDDPVMCYNVSLPEDDEER